MKHLTFKTVFLLALGSGKRRSEIHAWLHKNIRHQSDWSKVSLYPSPSFLSKNQLAKEGPDSVAPVVIPALAPSLDRSLKGDRSLCPVRALRYYLDRTADLRQNKELVFVSFKKGFDNDISPATISSWIKQTVVLCYELSDQEALTLHQVKAHDVRAFAARDFLRSDLVSLPLEISQHLHLILFEGCCLGRLRAFPPGTCSGCPTGAPPGPEVRRYCIYVNMYIL